MLNLLGLALGFLAAPSGAIPVDAVLVDSINDLRAEASGETSITLRWTSVGGYYLYIYASTTGPMGEAELQFPPYYVGATPPGPDGTPGSWEVTSLQSGETGEDEVLVTGREYWFVIYLVAYDGSYSLSNNASGVPREVAPPATINDLRVVATTFSSVTLQWTVPGDDEMQGQASDYDLRHTQAGPILDQDDFDRAIAIPDLPLPGQAATLQSLVVGGFVPGEVRYFSLRAVDEVGNWSSLGLSVEANLPTDVDPPAAIADLSASSDDPRRVTLRWRTPADNDLVTRYEVRGSTRGEILSEQDFAAGFPVAGTPASSGGEETLDVEGLRQTTAYWFAVRAVDRSSNMGGLSNSPGLRTLPGGSFGRDKACGGSASGPSPLLALVPGLLLAAYFASRIEKIRCSSSATSRSSPT